MKTCEVVIDGEICGRPTSEGRRGICEGHRAQLKRHQPLRRLREQRRPIRWLEMDLERLTETAMAFTVIEVVTGCWCWSGHRNPDGYGLIGVRGRPYLLHRWVYELAYGALNTDMQVGHDCHDRAAWAGECAGGKACLHRACWNLEHLVAQTCAENLASSPHRGRHRWAGLEAVRALVGPR